MGPPLIAVTTGDPAGIGPEVTAKALAGRSLDNLCLPLVIGDAATVRTAVGLSGVKLGVRTVEAPEEAVFEPDVVNVLHVGYGQGEVSYGSVSREHGEASIQYIRKALDLALEGRVAAVTTGPIRKKSVDMAGYYPGQMELIADLLGVADVSMLLVLGDFRVAHVTTHVSLADVLKMVKKHRVLEVIVLTHEFLQLIGLVRPRIGVLGLNPHAGDGGLFGREEIQEIRPAVEEAVARGVGAEGPLVPDTAFCRLKAGAYDALVVMHHDQGHIPFKLNGCYLDPATGRWKRRRGVRVTLGLPIIRTSVDHGAALDIAGQGLADPDSMINAIRMAAGLVSSGLVNR